MTLEDCWLDIHDAFLDRQGGEDSLPEAERLLMRSFLDEIGRIVDEVWDGFDNEFGVLRESILNGSTDDNLAARFSSIVVFVERASGRVLNNGQIHRWFDARSRNSTLLAILRLIALLGGGDLPTPEQLRARGIFAALRCVENALGLEETTYANFLVLRAYATNIDVLAGQSNCDQLKAIRGFLAADSLLSEGIAVTESSLTMIRRYWPKFWATMNLLPDDFTINEPEMDPEGLLESEDNHVA